MKASPSNPELLAFISTRQNRLEHALERWLPSAGTHPAHLHQAMRYSVLGQGKRLRPLLVYASGHALGNPVAQLDDPACAVELIHTYSLIHDDLPAMDNDDLRRGKPSCHRRFGEADAILAGDALQSLAFQVLSSGHETSIGAAERLRMIETLSRAAGSRGMAGGQSIDLDAVGRQLNIAELEDMHSHTTGALIRASVLLGALSGPGIDGKILESLDHYAKFIGLAFQVRDDILDVEGETEDLGKHSGADRHRNKPTYPALLGLSAAKQQADELYRLALDRLEVLGADADPLRWLAAYIVNRTY